MMQQQTKTLFLAIVAALAACNTSNFKGTSGKLRPAAAPAPALSKEFHQISYLPGETAAQQGVRGKPAVESFADGAWGKLDLLVVIDNSGSMAEEQVNLATKLDPLLSEIANADWQIAVVTTDPKDGCRRALVKKTDADAKTRFQAAINAGTQGDGLERGILQAVNGLRGDCQGLTPWVRDGSTVSVLIVSDEDNCHLDEARGYGCVGAADRDPHYLTDYLASIRTLGKDARIYGLIWHPTTPKSQCATALKSGDDYAKIIDESGGKWGSICDADYSTTLTAISADIAQILTVDFDLKAVPDAGSLVVTVDGKPWDKYELVGTKLRFTEPPAFGAAVEVAYRVGQQGEVATTVALAKVPLEGSLAVLVDGVALDPAAYHWDAAAQKLVFATAPADQAAIKITYKEAAPLTTAFAIATTADPQTIKVVVADAPVTAFTYDQASGLVTLAAAPAEAAVIRITWRDRG